MEKRRQLTGMARKFQLANEYGLVPGDTFVPELEGFRKEHYFFYGSLMDPATLIKVLKLRHQPELMPAKITGFSCKLWGPYPALVDGPPGNIVHGIAYVVERPSHLDLLEFYETNHYENMPCRIELQDGREVHGRTFVWNADEVELTEGTFDLKDWQKKNSGE
jgi:gamma-glutamylcyclotransferase (GGCT)/AIG2-like uncharacterized protein YtfP